MNQKERIELGSKIAKQGFKNEHNVVAFFNNWKSETIAQDWLRAMGYKLQEIELVHAEIIHGHFKADIQVQVTIKLKNLIDCQNIQVKLVSNKKGFNQIDKRWLNKYQELWCFPKNILKTLQYYTGELPPFKKNTKDTRRMFLNEIQEQDAVDLINWFNKNKTLVVSDILKGRGNFSAEWMLVIKKTNKYEWVLLPINIVINHYSNGDVFITDKGTLHMGKITIQRKGGDNGRDTAKMLQFKLDPTELFELKSVA